MTTLELLEEIRKAPAFMGGNERYKSVAGSDILYNEDIERIRKELKVLEILKRLIKLKHNTIKNKWVKTRSMGYIESARFEYESEEYKILKEWLKQ